MTKLVKKHVEDGAATCTDEHSGYPGLCEVGFEREAVQRSRGSVVKTWLAVERKDWRQIMRHALRVLETKDAQTIMSGMEAAKLGRFHTVL